MRDLRRVFGVAGSQGLKRIIGRTAANATSPSTTAESSITPLGEPAALQAHDKVRPERTRRAHTPRQQGDDGPRAFTTLWTADQVSKIRRAKLEGSPFNITFGGPHLSAPSFRRAGVRRGDIVIPIQVKGGRLHVISALRVADVLGAEEFIDEHPEDFDLARSDPEFQRMLPHLKSPELEAIWLVNLWLAAKPELAAVCPGETTEVVVGESVRPISLTRVAPIDLVPRLRWQSGRRPERPIRHLASDGTIERAVSLHGIYRLTEDSEAALLALA